jgi:hypothetical protein
MTVFSALSLMLISFATNRIHSSVQCISLFKLLIASSCLSSRIIHLNTSPLSTFHHLRVVHLCYTAFDHESSPTLFTASFCLFLYVKSLLPLWCRMHVEELEVSRLIRKLLAFYGTRRFSRVPPATGPYPEPDESSPHVRITFIILVINFKFVTVSVFSTRSQLEFEKIRLLASSHLSVCPQLTIQEWLTGFP